MLTKEQLREAFSKSGYTAPKVIDQYGSMTKDELIITAKALGVYDSSLDTKDKLKKAIASV